MKLFLLKLFVTGLIVLGVRSLVEALTTDDALRPLWIIFAVGDFIVCLCLVPILFIKK